MKRKLLLIASSLFLFAFGAQAQKARVTGQVSGKNGNIASATVMLYRAADSVLVKSDVTDGSGNFEIDGVNPGRYYVSATYVGYQKTMSTGFNAEAGQTFKVPALQMKEAERAITGVTVTGTYKKPMIEVKADKTIFNVESSINATGSNAFELLQKSPGVTTDKDDNISLKGKNGVRVYIDNRPVQMSGADLAAYLRSVNSADIEAIELITNPSAKYDAEGNAGIINIKFKKNKKYGTNGSVTAGTAIGKTAKTNSALSLNYRNKKVNLFSNYSNSWGDNAFNFHLYRETADTSLDTRNIFHNEGWNHNYKVGADIFASKEQTIGFIITGNLSNVSSSTTNTTNFRYLHNGQLFKILHAGNDVPTHNKNLNLNFNYRYADSLGHEFTIDANHSLYNNRKSSYQPNDYYSPFPETYMYSNNYATRTPTDIPINTVQLDYETPFVKGALGVGLKFSGVTTDNTFDNFRVYNGVYNFVDSISNNFSYKENVNAGYVNYNRTFNPKWALQAGVRVENTVSDGELTRADGKQQDDQSVKRNYTDLFPSAAITYNVNQKNALNLTYSRRIDRPNYTDLNPFENRLDELSYQKGNPFLRPQYTNSVQLIHTFMYKYNTTIGYSHIADFKGILPETKNGKSYITQKNLASQDIFNVNFSLPITITKWWSLYTNINAYRSHYKASYPDGNTIDLTVNSLTLYAQQSFTMGNGFTGEISGFYNAPSVWQGAIKSSALGTLDLGIQKTLFNGKGNIKFSYTDLLKTLHFAGSSNYGGNYFKVDGNWESQQLRMNFTYRFGNSQVKAARQRQTSAEEENKRTQSSGGLGGN